jgi:uncharacterized membrane protein YkvA (DUF1232 family)
MKRPLPISQRFLESLARWLAAHPRGMIIAAFVYLIVPMDLFPEVFLGPVGYLEDVAVLLLPYLIREYVKKLDVRKKAEGPYVDTTAE